jgi:GNAT superfamily N-acetyltransferase
MKLDRVEPLVPERWGDFERLFGARGACGGCWCMTPRLTKKEYEAEKGAGNRRAMRALVEKGPPPGVLGYVGGEAVAWCAIEPRERFVSLARSRVLAPVDEAPVWSIVCLFVAPAARGRGLMRPLVEGAVRWARSQGARLVEAYPIEPKSDRPVPAVFAWTGLAAPFADCGFVEVARRSPTRPILRRALGRRR